MNLNKRQNANGWSVQLSKTLALYILLGFIYNGKAEPVSINTKSYDPSSGVEMRFEEDTIVLGWDTPEGSTELSLNISGQNNSLFIWIASRFDSFNEWNG